MSAADNGVLTVQCVGCEAECQVEVAWLKRCITDIRGNNCPTGESFARAEWQRRTGEEYSKTGKFSYKD